MPSQDQPSRPEVRSRPTAKRAGSRKLGAALLLGAAVLCAGSAAVLYRARASFAPLAPGLSTPAKHMVKVLQVTQIAMALLAPAADGSARKVLPDGHGHGHGHAQPATSTAATSSAAAAARPSAAPGAAVSAEANRARWK